jgi:hypothetical protein
MSFQLAFSDYLATAAFVISVATFFYTKQQAESARVGTRNDARGRLAEHHKEYKAALKQINEKHRRQILSISNTAGDALFLVLSEFDAFDLADGAPRYLRHLAGECAEMMYYSFKGQLGWQSAINISHRFFAMTRLVLDLGKDAQATEPTDFRRYFERAYMQDPNAYLERQLLADRSFVGMLHALTRRIDTAKGGELLLTIRTHMQGFYEELTELRSALGPTIAQLEDLLDEGESDEHFPLHESPSLLGQLRKTHATFDTLGTLVLPHVNEEVAHMYKDFLYVAIYQCALLYAVQDVHCWGWKQL